MWAKVPSLLLSSCSLSDDPFHKGANQAVNFVVALTAPAFLAKSSFGTSLSFLLLHSYSPTSYLGPYFLYGSFTAFATFIAWIYMPETNGKSLETFVPLSLPHLPTNPLSWIGSTRHSKDQPMQFLGLKYSFLTEQKE